MYDAVRSLFTFDTYPSLLMESPSTDSFKRGRLFSTMDIMKRCSKFVKVPQASAIENMEALFAFYTSSTNLDKIKFFSNPISPNMTTSLRDLYSDRKSEYRCERWRHLVEFSFFKKAVYTVDRGGGDDDNNDDDNNTSDDDSDVETITSAAIDADHSPELRWSNIIQLLEELTDEGLIYILNRFGMDVLSRWTIRTEFERDVFSIDTPGLSCGDSYSLNYVPLATLIVICRTNPTVLISMYNLISARLFHAVNLSSTMTTTAVDGVKSTTTTSNRSSSFVDEFQYIDTENNIEKCVIIVIFTTSFVALTSFLYYLADLQQYLDDNIFDSSTTSSSSIETSNRRIKLDAHTSARIKSSGSGVGGSIDINVVKRMFNKK